VIRVVAWGIGGGVRDAGRPGLAHLGRSRGGALDTASLALANRLVGNADARAGIETAGGLHLVVEAPVLVALAGAQIDVDVRSGPPLGWGAPTVLTTGSEVRLGRVRSGARTYLAVRGGLVPHEPTEHDGHGAGRDTFTVGSPPATAPSTATAAPIGWPDTVRVWPGPRRDWFTAEAWDVLVSQPFTVGLGDRVGVRLDGPPIERRVHGELASEGLVEGAVQVPPDGRPIVMLADHPTTGGYPVIAVVDPDDLPAVVQAPQGASLRFRAAPAARR
jgi:allophanate hydrolase subunit 2